MLKIVESYSKPKNVFEINMWIKRQGADRRYCVMDRYCTIESTAEDCKEFFIMGNVDGVCKPLMQMSSIKEVISYFADGIYGMKQYAILRKDW